MPVEFHERISRCLGPVVMTVTTDDWMDVSDFERVTVHETGQVNITTRFVNSSGISSTLYSLSPGHIPRKLAGNNRMIDICPRQFLDITIVAADTPRGVGYDGNLIPRRVVLRYDNDSRWLSVEVNSEAETFEKISANGDTPGSGDVDLPTPPLPDLPELPDIPIIIPGVPEQDTEAALPCLLHSTGYGILYTANINTANPQWITVNAGLTSAQYTKINAFFRTPNGAFYALYYTVVDSGNYLTRPFFIARAPSIGGTFTIIKNESSVRPSPVTGQNWGLFAAAHNPLVAESVGV